MASRPVALTVAITLLASSFGIAFGQLGLSLGPTGSLDAVVADAPTDETLRVASLRTSEGQTVTPLALTHDAAGLRLSGSLPDLTDAPVLYSITAEEAWPCRPSVSDAGARFAPTEVFVEGLGVLRPGMQPPLARETPPGHVMLVLAYADRSVHVEVECVPSEERGGQVLRAAFTFDAGWNVLASSAVLDAGTEVVVLRKATPEELATGRWYAPPPELVTPQPPRVDQAPQDRRDDGAPAVPEPPPRGD